MENDATAAAGSLATGRADDADELTRIADELIDQIAATRRHYDDLRALLDGTPTAPAAAAPPAVAAPAPEAEEVDEFEPVHDPAGYHRTAEEEAEIVALGMALNGGSRHEAHTHIVETFGIYDTDDILDRAFGSEQARPAPLPRRRFGRLRAG